LDAKSDKIPHSKITSLRVHQLPDFYVSFFSSYRYIFSDTFYGLFDDYYPFSDSEQSKEKIKENSKKTD